MVVHFSFYLIIIISIIYFLRGHFLLFLRMRCFAVRRSGGGRDLFFFFLLSSRHHGWHHAMQFPSSASPPSSRCHVGDESSEALRACSSVCGWGSKKITPAFSLHRRRWHFVFYSPHLRWQNLLSVRRTEKKASPLYCLEGSVMRRFLSFFLTALFGRTTAPLSFVHEQSKPSSSSL